VERTLIIIKPDAVQRGLVGEIIHRFERRGLRMIAMKMVWIDESLAGEHYAIHRGKPFYKSLISYITSSPVVVTVLEGNNAIEVARSTMGATAPAKAQPGTIRADFGMEIGRNLVHGSDAAQTAEREVSLFFDEDEIHNWNRDTDRWIFE
jgi:nucleoside-diphosphate kinase